MKAVLFENPFIDEEPCALMRASIRKPGYYECSALTCECIGTVCSSYKTMAELNEQRRKCNERLCSLSLDEQDYIRHKYGIKW